MARTRPAQSNRNAHSRPRASKLATAIILGLVALAVAIALIVNNASSASRPEVPSAAGTTQGGSDSRSAGEETYPLPDFTLTDIKGEEVSAASLKGTPLWLVFSETWCPPCKAQMPGMQAATERYGSDALKVVTVFIGEDTATVSDFLTENGYTFTALVDPTRAVAAQFGVMGTPTNFFVDAEGNIRYAAPGMLTSEAIERALAEIAE